MSKKEFALYTGGGVNDDPGSIHRHTYAEFMKKGNVCDDWNLLKRRTYSRGIAKAGRSKQLLIDNAKRHFKNIGDQEVDHFFFLSESTNGEVAN
ncbi:MAG: hypothetical protein U0T75_12630 [Chitinophagales bacterium]